MPYSSQSKAYGNPTLRIGKYFGINTKNAYRAVQEKPGDLRLRFLSE